MYIHIYIGMYICIHIHIITYLHILHHSMSYCSDIQYTTAFFFSAVLDNSSLRPPSQPYPLPRPTWSADHPRWSHTVSAGSPSEASNCRPGSSFREADGWENALLISHLSPEISTISTKKLEFWIFKLNHVGPLVFPETTMCIQLLCGKSSVPTETNIFINTYCCRIPIAAEFL